MCNAGRAAPEWRRERHDPDAVEKPFAAMRKRIDEVTKRCSSVSEKRIALRPRIAPAIPLTLELDDEIDGKFTRKFRLCFDSEAIARVEKLTGISFVDGDVFKEPTMPDARRSVVGYRGPRAAARNTTQTKGLP